MKTITLTLRTDDAEPILRNAAFAAARYGGFLDHFTRKTVDMPNVYYTRGGYDVVREEWTKNFLAAKRIVEAFGIEYEPTSEEETLTIYIPHKVLKSHLVNAGGVTFRHIDKSIPDPTNSRPMFRGQIHTEACNAAAERVVRKWREMHDPEFIAKLEAEHAQ